MLTRRWRKEIKNPNEPISIEPSKESPSCSTVSPYSYHSIGANFSLCFKQSSEKFNFAIALNALKQFDSLNEFRPVIAQHLNVALYLEDAHYYYHSTFHFDGNDFPIFIPPATELFVKRVLMQ